MLCYAEDLGTCHNLTTNADSHVRVIWHACQDTGQLAAGEDLFIAATHGCTVADLRHV